MQQVELTEYTCDGCGSTTYANVEIDGPPVGYHGGNVGRVHGGGGDGCENWFACRERCIKAAVVNAIDKDSRR